MIVNRDPDGRAEFTPAMQRIAEQSKLQPISVLCMEHEEDSSDDYGGITFIALVPFLPQIGNRIQLEDGKNCIVKNVFFKTVKFTDANDKAEAVGLMPNVVAYPIKKI